MPQDAFTLKYLCDELNNIFAGGKINRIVQPDNDQVICTVYTGKKTEKLLLCVNPASPRIGVVNDECQSPLTAPNFCMLLRKHLISATINGISLIGFDRIVKIELTPSNEFFDDNKKVLFVELMGRYSNIILTENGRILGANRGINVFDNGVRPLFVGKQYVYPPVNDKKEPNDQSLVNIFQSYENGDLAQFLVDNVQGIALSTAKEIVAKFNKVYSTKDINFSNKFFEFLNNFLYNSSIKPCVVYQDGLIKDVCVFPYEDISGEKVFFDHLWQAEQYFFINKEYAKKFSAKKDRAKSIVSTAIKKIKKKISLLNARENDALSMEQNRIFGELLIANLYKVKQGQSSCSCYNYYDNSTVEIPLDINLSPSKNAEIYFKKYNKQKRTLQAIAPQKEGLLTELDYFTSVLEEIEICESLDDLVPVYEELENFGLIKDQQQNKRKNIRKEFREYLVDDFTVLVGKNNVENDRLTFSAKPDDVWLHVKDYHSSHVIIKTNSRAVPVKIIEKVASICAYYSKCRDSGKVEVVYTQKKNVKKPSKSKPGFCTYVNFNCINVMPNKYIEFLKNE